MEEATMLYGIDDGNGNVLCEGIAGRERAECIARERATDLREPVYLYEMRRDAPPSEMICPAPGSLDALLELLREGEMELTGDLPVFGGPEPVDTRRVWSWDPERVLVGTHVGQPGERGALLIASRPDDEEEEPVEEMYDPSDRDAALAEDRWDAERDERRNDDR